MLSQADLRGIIKRQRELVRNNSPQVSVSLSLDSRLACLFFTRLKNRRRKGYLMIVLSGTTSGSFMRPKIRFGGLLERTLVAGYGIHQTCTWVAAIKRFLGEAGLAIKKPSGRGGGLESPWVVHLEKVLQIRYLVIGLPGYQPGTFFPYPGTFVIQTRCDPPWVFTVLERLPIWQFSKANTSEDSQATRLWLE